MAGLNSALNNPLGPFLEQAEQSKPANPAPGYLRIYPKSDNNLYTLNASGVETLIGAMGPAGPQGIQGPPGNTGAAGPTGPQGPIGNTGPAGPQGSEGPIGQTGPTGQTGAQGPIGLTGPQGNDGAQGPIGQTGPQGNTGPQGPQGNVGPQGNAGPGVAAGGAPNQVLSKLSAADFDTSWVDMTGGGGGIPDAPSDNNNYGRNNAAWVNLGATYVTQAQTDSWYLRLTGGVIQGNVIFLSGQITMATSPTAAAHVTTKAYVDNQINFLTTLITDLQTKVAQNITDIENLQADVADLQTRMGTAESNIAALYAHDSTQDQAISDLARRVTALEQGGIAPQGGPFIGDMVHTRDDEGHCQPSIVYEDWGGRNASGTVSIAVLSPVRLSQSPWDSYIEVIPDGPNSAPYTTWHWPEMAFPYRRELFRKVAAHAAH